MFDNQSKFFCNHNFVLCVWGIENVYTCVYVFYGLKYFCGHNHCISELICVAVASLCSYVICHTHLTNALLGMNGSLSHNVPMFKRQSVAWLDEMHLGCLFPAPSFIL